MTDTSGLVLVVDDFAVNRMLLARILQTQGRTAVTVDDGLGALEFLRGPQGSEVDVVLLDLMMPELDGYETLRLIKEDPRLRHVPVIIVSELDHIDSVVRCVEMGATDYLPKPVDPALLRARLGSSTAEKRLRDLELDYLEQVGHVITAATALEAGVYDPVSIEPVTARTDALGVLARSFQRMAREVRAREQTLERTVRDLRIDLDQARQQRAVDEITGSDYFRELREQAHRLRRLPGDQQP